MVFEAREADSDEQKWQKWGHFRPALEPVHFVSRATDILAEL